MKERIDTLHRRAVHPFEAHNDYIQSPREVLLAALDQRAELLEAVTEALDWYQHADAEKGQEGFPAGVLRAAKARAEAP